MQPIVTNRVAWSVGWSVGLSQSWALQKQLNRLRCYLGWGLCWAPGIVLDRGPISTREWAIFGQKGTGPGRTWIRPTDDILKLTQRGQSGGGTEPVWCGCWLGCTRWGAHWCNLVNTIEPSMRAAMQSYVKLVWPLVKFSSRIKWTCTPTCRQPWAMDTRYCPRFLVFGHVLSV